uniref:Uncharacterized protein n=1 Tax=Magnetococcus massalia (strain MO-1) TaxID=451514 RepID=A0A1S7LM26_MAGMO|nr:protein of unknown function [Candidatus Magnetococcus massalia]
MEQKNKPSNPVTTLFWAGVLIYLFYLFGNLLLGGGDVQEAVQEVQTKQLMQQSASDPNRATDLTVDP